MATSTRPAAEPWYPFNSGPPKAHAADKAAQPSAAPATPAAAQAASAKTSEQDRGPSLADLKAHMKATEAGLAKNDFSGIQLGQHSPAERKAEMAARAHEAGAVAQHHEEKTAKTAAVSQAAPPVKSELAHKVAQIQQHPHEKFAKEAGAVIAKAEAHTTEVKPTGKSAHAPEVAKGTQQSHEKGAKEAGAVVAKADGHTPGTKPLQADPHAHAKPARPSFIEALAENAKDIARANSLVESGLKQGLTADAMKAMAEHRLAGNAKEIANQMLSNNPDAIVLAVKVAENRQLAGALQSAASRASSPDTAQDIVAAKMKGGDLAAGHDAVNRAVESTNILTKALKATDPLVSDHASIKQEPQDFASSVKKAPQFHTDRESETTSVATSTGPRSVEAATAAIASSSPGAVQAASASLEQALMNHMANKGFDLKSVSAAPEIASAIREGRGTKDVSDSVLVLHKDGARGDPLATVVAGKDAAAIVKSGDSVLAMDTLEKIAVKGLNPGELTSARESASGTGSKATDLELSQTNGAAKTEMKGFDKSGSSFDPQAMAQQAAKIEKSSAAEHTRAEMHM